MGGSSKKVTVGYKYYLGMHMILCHGPIDAVRRILVDKRTAWQGSSSGGSLSIQADGLFGGEEREGGVSGTIDIEMGRGTQTRNSYLQARLGTDIPAFRGVVGVVLRQCYLGMNPYLKAWSFRAQRIHVRQDGIAQWYDDKSEIPLLGNKGAPIPLLWTLPCQAPTADSRICQCPVSRNDTFNYVSAESGPQTVNIRIRGVVEGQAYSFSPGYQVIDTSGSISVVKGVGSPTQALVNVYTLTISNPPATYYLNHGSFDYDVHAVDFSFPIQVANGATVNLFCTSVDGAQANNRNNRTVAIDPDYSLSVNQPFNGQFLQLDGLFGHKDMNPAHIIRECLTDPDWGMGYQDSDIDDASFSAAADTLWDEKMGISLLWDRQTPLESFVGEIVKHIDAALYVSRTTGKFVLKLIRKDYDEESLIHLDESNVVKVDNPTKPTFGELNNSVTVNYWSAETGNDASVTVTDTAMVQMQGSVINTTVQYPGFTNSTIATLAAQRDLRSLSSPLLSCTIYADQTAKDLNIGDTFKFSWSRWNVDSLVMRVTGIAFGDGKTNQVRITCTQDVFDTPTVSVVADPGTGWVDPVGPPQPATNRLAFEAPYYELVQAQGQVDIDDRLASRPELGYLMACLSRQDNAINAKLWVDAGAGFEESGIVDFCPSATLKTAINKISTSWSIENLTDADLIQTGTFFQIGTELCRLDSIDTSTGAITVGRGVLDSVPQEHSIGEVLYFWDVYSGADPSEYVQGEILSVKMTPVTGQGQLDLTSAPQDDVLMSQRASRPYPPGQFKINGSYYPNTIGGSDSITVTWVHRDRKQQTGGSIVDFTSGNIGPESGSSYRIRIYDENGVLIKTQSGIVTTSWTYPIADETSDSNNLVQPGDPDYASVSLLLHLDGTNGATTFTDNSQSPKTVTGNGNAQISTAQSKFGGASLLLDGNGDFLSIAANAAFNFGTSDFTVETFIYNTSETNNYQTFFGNFNSASYASGARFFMVYGGSAPIVAQRRKIGFGGFNLDTNQSFLLSTTSILVNTWYHVAVTRQGNTFRLFVNGVLEATATKTDAMDFSINGTRIGANGWDGVASNFTGHIDELRVTKGVCRYSATFTPPTVPFENQSGAAGGKRPNGLVRVELETVRDGLASYQFHSHTVERTGYGYNYGDRYGQ